MICRNYFYCLCYYCVNDLKLDDLPHSQILYSKPNPSVVFSSVEYILHSILMNWNFIDVVESKHPEKHPQGTFESFWATKLNRTAFDALISALYK
jgi:hypothetical protein